MNPGIYEWIMGELDYIWRLREGLPQVVALTLRSEGQGGVSQGKEDEGSGGENILVRSSLCKNSEVNGSKVVLED